MFLSTCASYEIDLIPSLTDFPFYVIQAVGLRTFISINSRGSEEALQGRWRPKHGPDNLPIVSSLDLVHVPGRLA